MPTATFTSVDIPVVSSSAFSASTVAVGVDVVEGPDEDAVAEEVASSEDRDVVKVSPEDKGAVKVSPEDRVVFNIAGGKDSIEIKLANEAPVTALVNGFNRLYSIGTGDPCIAHVSRSHPQPRFAWSSSRVHISSIQS